MGKKEKISYKSLTRNYLLALFLVVLLSLVSFFGHHRIIATQEMDAIFINLSARQSMLVQRIATFTLHYVVEVDENIHKAIEENYYESEEDEEEDIIIEEIRKSLTLFENSHNALSSGDADAVAHHSTSGYVHDAFLHNIFMGHHGISNEIFSLYFRDPLFLDDKAKQFIEEVKKFLDLPKNEILYGQENVMYIIHQDLDELIFGLDKIASQYEHESFDRITAMKVWLTAILILTVILVICIGMFLFRPMVRDIISKQKKLEESSALKDDFLSIASHELRTPMSVVTSYVSMLLDDSFGKISDAQRKFLEKISRNVNALIDMVNDMLDITKLESEKMAFHFQEIHVESFLRSIIKEYKILYKKKNIELSLKISKEKDYIIFADADKVKRVFVNLLGNAYKFTPENGVVEVYYYPSKTIENAIEFEVRDSGIGIDAEKIPHIFDKFLQVENPLQRKYPGTGLGLAIVKNVIEYMNGYIWVESIKGEGASFFFTLPLSTKN